jgi:hypothetical protein
MATPIDKPTLLHFADAASFVANVLAIEPTSSDEDESARNVLAYLNYLAEEYQSQQGYRELVFVDVQIMEALVRNGFCPVTDTLSAPQVIEGIREVARILGLIIETSFAQNQEVAVHVRDVLLALSKRDR